MKVVFSPTKQKLYSPPWDWIRDKPIYLTRNKVYDVLATELDSYNKERYFILNNEGYAEWFDEYHFVKLDTIRNEKINSILEQ